MWFRRDRKEDPEAKKALREAYQHLEEVQSRSEEVHRVAEASREFRRRNHFAEDLSQILHSHRPKKGHS